MKIIKAKILDPTHLELNQPISLHHGVYIHIRIPDEDQEELLWQKKAKEYFLKAYSGEDAIYDKL